MTASASHQPDEISTVFKEQIKSPEVEEPQWVTKSISRKPTFEVSHSVSFMGIFL